MNTHYAETFRWFLIAGIIALMTLGAFAGIYEMVKEGIIPRIFGLFLI